MTKKEADAAVSDLRTLGADFARDMLTTGPGGDWTVLAHFPGRLHGHFWADVAAWHAWRAARKKADAGGLEPEATADMIEGATTADLLTLIGALGSELVRRGAIIEPGT